MDGYPSICSHKFRHRHQHSDNIHARIHTLILQKSQKSRATSVKKQTQYQQYNQRHESHNEIHASDCVGSALN